MRRGDYGFTIEDLSAGAEITQFAQTYNPCTKEPEKPCNRHYPKEGVYSAQFKFEASQESVTFRVVWKDNNDDVTYWNSHKPPDVDREIDLSTYTDIL